MQAHLRTNRNLVYALLGLIALSLGILASSEVGHYRLKSSYDDVILETGTSNELQVLVGLVAQAESSQRGYLLTERKKYLDAYNTARPSITPLFTKLQTVYAVSNDAQLTSDFKAVAVAFDERLSLLDTTFGMATSGKKELALELFKTDIGEEKMELLRASVQRLLLNERQRTTQSVEGLERNHEIRFLIP